MKTIKLSIILLAPLVFQVVYAATSPIVPEDKAKLHRTVGESVYVECKKAGPFSTNCQVNCGNGMRFQKASGYCYYLRPGNFTLNVNTRYRNKEVFHTATVTVAEKTARNHVSSKMPITQSALPAEPAGSAAILPGPATGQRPIPATTFNGGNSQSFTETISSSNQVSVQESTSVQLQNQFTQNQQNNSANLDNALNSFNQTNSLSNSNSNLNNNLPGNQNTVNNQNSNRFSFNQ